MENKKQKSSQLKTGITHLLSQPAIQKRFEDILGKKAQGFISSIINTVSNDKALQACEPQSILRAAAIAATLDLPIDRNLGFAWIIPYGQLASFQMGYKGFIQLALRTGEYVRMNVVPVYENQFQSFNHLTEELKADFSIDGEGSIVGYACYWRLRNNFEKVAYWTIAKVEKHAKRFSQAYRAKKESPWDTDFDKMAMKTVLKNTLSVWGILRLSIEMQRAITHDQGVIEENSTIVYPDGIDLTVEAEEELNKKKAEDFENDSEPDDEPK